MVIKVLGSGCPTCQKLEMLVKEAAIDLNVSAEIQKVTDIKKIAEHGIIRTPGLIINEKVVSQGKLPSLETLKHWIENSVKEE